jgi:hypothetical protein
MSYSIEDAIDRDAMTALHVALEVVDKKIRSLRERGFTVQLLDERPDMNGRRERSPLSQSYQSTLDGRLVARVTKSYDLPYSPKPEAKDG